MFSVQSKPTKENTFISHLFDEKSFYTAFIRDLKKCEDEVIIESPFISTSRMSQMHTVFEQLVDKGVRTYVITRDPGLHDGIWAAQSENEIRWFEAVGVQVVVTLNNHHRKLAILDRKTLWEGSLNILSQINSREVMRRIEGAEHANEMFNFLKLDRMI